MRVSAALRARAKLSVLLNCLVQAACRRGRSGSIDRRNLRTFRQLVLGMLTKRSTHLLELAQMAASWRQVSSVKSAAMALGYFLKGAKFPMRAFATWLLEAALRQLPAERLATYRGKPLLVVDPTEYQKRSRGRGKRGRQMQHIGRVRKSKAKGAPKRKKKTANNGASKEERKVATTFGYVDVWAGLVLKGKQFLPLARQLFSSNHPKMKSQNRVEQAVLGQALELLERVSMAAIVVADRGLGRKELLIRLAGKARDLVIRIDADINVIPSGTNAEVPLATALGEQPWLGEVVWDRGEEGKLHCQARALRATIRFSRSGRKDDYEEATLNFLELVPEEENDESLVVATTLPLRTLPDARGIAWVYGQRWAVETAFETMHAWGQDRFMVRDWQAIDRLLWIVGLSYALMVLALLDQRLASFRHQAIGVLKGVSVLGRRLTVGKLAEAIGLDYSKHQRAWTSAWFSGSLGTGVSPGACGSPVILSPPNGHVSG